MIRSNSIRDEQIVVPRARKARVLP
jgi:hypothetical protein